jgi:2-polyprenyl-6-methoxyphenol hydroxylase-like FAD-dependent oxidoreductase
MTPSSTWASPRRRAADPHAAALDRWHGGRVVLIGDAAHAAPAHMGEGGSMATEDAVVLTESLRSAGTVASALERYVERRRPLIAAP